VPLRLTLLGLPPPSWLIFRVPVFAPFDVGLNLTVKVHDDLAGTWVPQLLLCRKLLEMLTPVIFNALLRVFVSVTLCDGLVLPTERLAKVNVNGVSLTYVPMPLKLTLLAVLLALVVRESEPVRVFAPAGLNETCA
jgi:hypothetical protein